MARKRKTDEDLLLEHREAVREQISYWKDLNENGSSDPAWPDGMNMNLVRNHFMYHKRKIVEVCERNGWPLPDEYYLPMPPEAVMHKMIAPKVGTKPSRRQSESLRKRPGQG